MAAGDKKILVDDWRDFPKWASVRLGAIFSAIFAGLMADPTLIVSTAQLVLSLYKQVPADLHAVIPVAVFIVMFGVILFARLWRQGQD